MHIEDVAGHLKRREAQRGLCYTFGIPATPDLTTATEARLGISFPQQVTRFYRHYDGIRIEEPPLEVLPVARFTFVAPQRLHFATVDESHLLGFDTSAFNEAGQWKIVDIESDYRVTLTMASFWSNKIWAWIDKRRTIWKPESALDE